jgi:hypothetical protein
VSEIVVTNGTAGTFAGSGTTYTANITPSGQGTVTVSVAANVATDAATNGNTSATNLTRVFDNVVPTVVITSSASDPTGVSPIPVTITFSESVTGFVVSDITVTNGTAGTFAGSGTTYTANITPTTSGAVTVSVGAGKAADAATNGNVVSNTLSRTFTSGVLTNQTITFDAITNKTLGDAAFNVTATASSGLAVAFSSASDKITIAGAQVTMIKAGSVTVTANQAGDASFNPAASVDRTFCINPAKPTISISGADTETVVLTSSSATGNQWFKDGVSISAATANTLNVISVGTYSVQVTVETCISIKSNDFPIIVTGLELHPRAATVYPNPTVGKVTIQIPGGRGGDIQIATLTGIPVLVLASHRDKEELIIDHFSAGMYFVTITTPTGLFKTRLVKQ